MPQIGTLTTGVGVQTNITGLTQCDAIITIGSVDTTNPLQALIVEIDGTTFLNIPAASLITAYQKWMMSVVGTIIGIALKIATGRINKPTNLRFTNAGATTPAIYAFSDSNDGIPFVVASQQINASSYADFSQFAALFIQTPANVSSAEVTFRKNVGPDQFVYYKQTMAIQDLATLFAMQPLNEAEASGYLGGVLVIDNRAQTVESVRIYCSTANTILVAKLPQESFDVAKRMAQGAR